MNFHELSLPQAKRYKADSSLKAFPINQIPETNDDKEFTGIFNGLSVEISDHYSIINLYSNGCFGVSTKTKTTPQLLQNFSRMQNVTQSQYSQKFEWNAKFLNRNPDLVMINLLSPTKDVGASKNQHKSDEDSPEESMNCENIKDSTECVNIDDDDMVKDKNDIDQTMEAEENLVLDPFPLEETLALCPEEAFFLHFSLRCLKIVSFNQRHEFTTEELLDIFCQMNPKFIERFVAYQYYRSKNWVVKGGLKFGGDFLLYYKGPSYYHASYVVLVNDSEDEVNQLDMQSNYRVSDSTKKEMIIATITRPKNLEYSRRSECLNRLKEFQITEFIPKRLTINQLSFRS